MNHPRRGFTLTEMMVVIAIIILVSVISIPIIRPMFAGRTMASGIIVIQSAIQKAMSEAARTGEVYYVSYNTYKPFQHMLVIYSGEQPEDWDAAWNDPAGKYKRRKGMVVGRPVLMTKGTRLLGVTQCMYENNYNSTYPGRDGVKWVINGSCGDESYLKITPTGEIIPRHQKAFANGRITWLDPDETAAITYANPESYDTIVIGVEDFKFADQNDLTKFRPINLNLMTGDLFDEFD